MPRSRRVRLSASARISPTVKWKKTFTNVQTTVNHADALELGALEDRLVVVEADPLVRGRQVLAAEVELVGVREARGRCRLPSG